MNYEEKSFEKQALELLIKYEELKEAVIGDSPNWTHEEIIEKILYLVDLERRSA